MGNRSQEDQGLMKIQHEWAEARVKGDSSYTRRIEADDCTIVWPDGRIVNKRGDLESAASWRHWHCRRRWYDKSAQGKTSSSRRKIRVDRHICEAGRSMEGGRFANHCGFATHSGLGKVITHSYR